jgi:tRNA/rRNA methyltransferase
VALVFGGEADGLRKRELSRLDGLVRIPTGPHYQDLNLAQSVVVCAYELFLAAGAPQAPREPASPDEELVPHEAEQHLFEAMRELLSDVGFLKEEGTALSDELRRRLGARQLTRREAILIRGMLSQIRWALGHSS